MSWCVMDGETQNKRFHDLVFMEGLSEKWEGKSANPSPSQLGYDLSFTVIHTSLGEKKEKKKLLPAFTYLTLNPAKSLWNTIPFSSIIPFDSLFHSSLPLAWYTYNVHTFFPPSSSKLPLIHSSMTLTSAPLSFLFESTVSFYSPLFPGCLFQHVWMMIHECIASLQLKLEWPKKKKNTLQSWLFIIITRSNGTWSANCNGPLTLQIEKEGNENRQERVREGLAHWIRGL